MDSTLGNELRARHPEKTFLLGQVFNDATNSYKYFWFLSLLSLIERTTADTFPVTDVLTEMGVQAWHPALLFRLSFGTQDKLQLVVADIEREAKVESNASPAEIRQLLNSIPGNKGKLHFLGRYVPTRFLTPWFTAQLAGMGDSLKDAAIRKQISRRRLEQNNSERQKRPMPSRRETVAAGQRCRRRPV